MSWSIYFPSQTTLHPYGHLICTPISCLAATSFLGSSAQNHNEIQSLFNIEFVNKMMIASHELYREVFSPKGMQLMIEDIYPWLSKDLFTILEASGLVVKECFLSSSHVIDINDGLLLIPLLTLVKKYIKKSRSETRKTSIIVTTKGHTICYMCSENGDLYIFDALPASLTFVPTKMLTKYILEQYNLKQCDFLDDDDDIQYSAVVLQNV
jgi:hypothetical protein